MDYYEHYRDLQRQMQHRQEMMEREHRHGLLNTMHHYNAKLQEQEEATQKARAETKQLQQKLKELEAKQNAISEF